MKRQPETRAEGGQRRPGPSGCANARRGPAWPGPGPHRPSGRPPSPHPRHPEYEDRTAQAPSRLAPARANTDQPPLAPPVLAIPASLAAGGAGRRGAKAHDAQPIALRRRRGPSQWERGTSSPLLPILQFSSILLVFFLKLTPLRSGPTEDAERRDFRRMHAHTHALLTWISHCALRKPSSVVGVQDSGLVQGRAAWTGAGAKNEIGVCKSLFLPVALSAAETLGRIRGAAGGRGIGKGSESF